MQKKKKFVFIIGLLTIVSLSTILPLLNSHDTQFVRSESTVDNPLDGVPKSSINLEGIEDIGVISINRTISITGSGLLFINDTLMVENQNEFSISSILFSIPSNISDDLVYLKTMNSDGSILNSEKTDFIMESIFEMVEIKLETPLNPQENRTFTILHSYKDIIKFELVGTNTQHMNLNTYLFPLLPYQAEGTIVTYIDIIPATAEILNVEDWMNQINVVVGQSGIDWYDLKIECPRDYLAAFSENIGSNKTISISIKYSGSTKLEVSNLDRTITISPWGIITVRENYYISNLGPISIGKFRLSIPYVAVNEKVFDFFGAFEELTFAHDTNIPSLKTAQIGLANSRSKIEPNSTYTFSVEYQMSLHNYITENLIQQSIRMSLCTSYFEYLGKDINIKVIIESSFNLKGYSIIPDDISSSTGKTTLTYHADYITPYDYRFDDKTVTLTYTVNSFGLLFWPIIYMISIAGVCILYIIIINRRKKRGVTPMIEEKEIPVNEIREFCTLYSEKTALILEIRKAEGDLKSKKIPKKKYRMLLKKNENKINSIEEELEPFKETLIEASETFESLVKRLELLETERQTVRDGLNLLDLRYRKGKLPSRSAYLSLRDDFEKRLKKIDRSIDKTIQNLRGYLL